MAVDLGRVVSGAKPLAKIDLKTQHRDALAEQVATINDSGTLAMWGYDAMLNAFVTHKEDPGPQLEVMHKQLQKWWTGHSLPADKFKHFCGILSK